jgi:hypothetical protein
MPRESLRTWTCRVERREPISVVKRRNNGVSRFHEAPRRSDATVHHRRWRRCTVTGPEARTSARPRRACEWIAAGAGCCKHARAPPRQRESPTSHYAMASSDSSLSVPSRGAVLSGRPGRGRSSPPTRPWCGAQPPSAPLVRFASCAAVAPWRRPEAFCPARRPARAAPDPSRDRGCDLARAGSHCGAAQTTLAFGTSATGAPRLRARYASVMRIAARIKSSTETTPLIHGVEPIGVW